MVAAANPSLPPAAIERGHIYIELAHAPPKRVHIREQLGGTLTEALALLNQSLEFTL